MTLYLSGPPTPIKKARINITGSKSESNRLLLLQALYPNLKIENLSNADDVKVMMEGLKVTSGTVDIHHAGTAMRFLTAYFATKESADVTLTGSSRMQERPIKVLVDALRQLGADIEYLKTEGYPPLRIRGKKLERSKVSLPANISSQYISALLLVAPGTQKGLELELLGEITSVPYIKMTLSLLNEMGIKSSFSGNKIKVGPTDTISARSIRVESDWSSASYFYSIAAFSEIGTHLELTSYKDKSLQGDRVLADIYRHFGVETRIEGSTLHLIKNAHPGKPGEDKDVVFNFHLADAPDIAQTIAVNCFGLQIGCRITGLHTLKIKETDRLEALKIELTKLGARIEVSDHHLEMTPVDHIEKDVSIATYKDHRMAMAFAPLALKTNLYIEEAEVVSKSYPDFWRDLEQLNFQISQTDH
ncbi:3-phosphoshikimate 1-carboxyvinyltransferase [Muriicola soli]|uniref:3-phosphoshikimate 1-carboxyvinyltransferase n=1 Tax=Muriicola soli TaxID=2507538 RepID=UPI001FE4E2BC|nr:3-phosphoshikimate 1-carboxyvinyltransferase [Muriicola soli]